MKILLASEIDRTAVKMLEANHEVVRLIDPSQDEFADAASDVEALIFRSGVDVGRRILESAPKLKLVIRAGSGLDNVDAALARSRGISLYDVPEPSAQAVAELAFGLLISAARHVCRADRLLRSGTWAKYELEGQLLANRTLGIVGAGNIGARVGKMAGAWGMRVLGVVEPVTEEARAKLARDGIELVGLQRLLNESDFVTVHVPLNPSTRNLIDAEKLSWMKREAILVNLSRGGVVDENDLARALKDGRIAGAGVDVYVHEGRAFSSPLTSCENVTLTPHIGSTTSETQRQIGERIVEIVSRHQGPVGEGRRPNSESPPEAVEARSRSRAIE